MESASAWAQQQFGGVALGDTRRTQRAVELATAFAHTPDASLPQACASWAALKSAYRLLGQAEVTRAALSAEHWQQTRQGAMQEGVTLLLSDLTEVDYTAHPAVTGLGRIGDGHGRGFHVQTTLAYRPEHEQIVGVAYQQTFRRQESGLTRGQRRHRHQVESAVWNEAVTTLGTPPPGARWVHVGDRAADIWSVFRDCLAHGTDFVIRVQQQHRQVWLSESEPLAVAEIVAHLPVQGTQVVPVAQRGGRAARQAQVQIRAGTVQVPPPRAEGSHAGSQTAALTVGLIVVEEPDAPEEREPLNWLLWTSLPVADLAAAQECITWYRMRWLIEDYHQCLKTGCRLEQRQLRTADELDRLLGILGPVAAYLLQMRQVARQVPTAPALRYQPVLLVHVVARLAGTAPAELTCAQFWQTVARRGGWLGRTGDGPPGWKTVWAGWQSIQTLVEGVLLATQLSPNTG